MSFNSNENKALLWGLMYEGGVFTNIPPEHLSKVKEMFETKIESWNNMDGSILDRNKKAMMEMVKDLEKLRNKSTLNSDRNYDTPVTTKEIQNQRREKFNTNLEKKQNEFNEMITAKKPSRPDFTDTPDETPIGSEMDKLLADMIAKRDLQLNNATAQQDSNVAQEWITKDNKNPESFTNSITTQRVPLLKIGESLDKSNVENIKIDVSDEVNEHKKRVTFAETNSTSDFFQKFKLTERDNNEIIKDIQKIREEINNRLSKIDDLLVELN
jgi:hypothetical protein